LRREIVGVKAVKRISFIFNVGVNIFGVRPGGALLWLLAKITKQPKPREQRLVLITIKYIKLGENALNSLESIRF